MLRTKIFTKDADGNELVLSVRRPSARNQGDADIYGKAKYGEAVAKGVMIRAELEMALRKKNLWDDERQQAFERLRRSLLQNERSLRTKRSQDGKPLRLKDARETALQMSRDRAALIDLLSVRNEAERKTAEAVEEQARFEHLVAACTAYAEGPKENNPFFTADGLNPLVDAYVEQAATDVGNAAATALYEMLNGKPRDALASLPENAFLLQHKFIDQDLHLIDEKGRKVDEAGRLVDDEGYFVNEKGDRVDLEGNPVDENGDFACDPDAHFVDDEGNPVD